MCGDPCVQLSSLHVHKQACSEGLLDGKLLANGKDEPHQAEKYPPKNVKQGLILFYIKDASFSLDADHTNLPFLSDVLSDYSLHFFFHL